MKFTNLLLKIKEHQHIIQPKLRYVGIFFTLFAWFLIAFSVTLWHTTSKTLSHPSYSFFFFQSIFMFLALFLCAIFRGIKFLIPKKPFFVFFRGGLGITAYYMYSSSKSSSTFFDVDNSVLFNTEALFVPLLLWVFLRIKVEILVWIGVILGFVGIGTIYYFDLGFCIKCALIGLGAGGILAIVIVITSYMVAYDNPLTIALYQSAIGIIVAGILAYFQWQPLDIKSLLSAAFSGIAFAVALFLFLDSFYYTEGYLLACLGYSTVLYQGFLDYFIFDQTITYKTWIGFALIFFGGLVTILSAKLLDKKTSHLSIQK